MGHYHPKCTRERADRIETLMIQLMDLRRDAPTEWEKRQIIRAADNLGLTLTRYPATG